MLNHLQSIVKENHYQLLDIPGTDPAQYITNHPGTAKASKWYRVDISCPETWLAYSRLIIKIKPSISLLSNEIQVHIRIETARIFSSTADFVKLPISINMQSHSRHASGLCIPTLHYPWVIHFASFWVYFLPSWICWICVWQHTQSVNLSDTKLSGAGAADSARPQLISECMLDR